MIDKSLVKRRFKKSLSTYTDNAIIQKQMAKELINMLPSKKFDKVFEIGCSTGILTKEIAQNIKYNEIYINDLVTESKNYINEILPDFKFIPGDIETIETNNKYDLIISNACLQWCNDIFGTINKLYNALNENGVLAISIFGDSNLKQIKQIFKINEKSYSVRELKQILNKYQTFSIIERNIDLYFSNLKEILQHLKYTGANSIKEYTLTKSALQEYEKQYSGKFSVNNNVVLTYNPVYIVISKKKA